MLSTGDLAQRYKVSAVKIWYLIAQKRLPGPSYRVRGRYLFSEQDAAALGAELERLRLADDTSTSASAPGNAVLEVSDQQTAGSVNQDR